MVKKFMKGLINKDSESQDSSEEQSNDDTPDELPPLSDEEDAKETDESTSQDEEDVPDELPSFDDEDIDEKPKEETESEEKESPPKEDKENVPKELPSFDEEDSDEEPSEEEQPQEKETEKPKEPKKTEKKTQKKEKETEKHKGFFSKLLNITKDQGINKELLSRDLYSGMKRYEEPKTSIETTNREKIQKTVVKKLDELKSLESKWREQKKKIEESKKILEKQEEKIKQKSENLKPLLKKLNYYKDAPVGKYFRTHDGVIAKNISELLQLIKLMDEETFQSYLSDNQNSFALWIRDVIGDKNIAEKLENTDSREKTIEILEESY